ncbi:MAG: hypothetical protein WDZ59_13605 [Pirellulales bacterium]
MATTRRPSRRIALLLAVAAAGAAIGGVVWLVDWPPRMVTHRWSVAIEGMPDAEAVAAIAKLPEWGDAGLPVLVELLGSERTLVAGAARDTLKAELLRWRRLWPRQAAGNLAQLARSLRISVSEFDPSAQREAKALARRILRWPLDSTSIDRVALVADCQQVFSASTAAERVAARIAGAQITAHDRSASAAVAGQMADLPGGNLPIDVTHVPLPEMPAFRSNSAIALAPPPDASGSAPPGVIQPDLGKPIPPGQSAAGSSMLRIADTPDRPATESRAGAPPTEGPDNRPLVAREPLAVMHALQDRREQVRAAAHAELLRRGFSEVEVAVARRLTDPDAAERLALVGHLPQIAGIDPEPWLLWLCRDENADVRLAALTLIATTGSRHLLRAVEPIARQDRDPRVAELAGRLFAPQGGSKR